MSFALSLPRRATARILGGLVAACALAGAAHAGTVYSHVQPGAQVSFQATQMGVAMKGHFAKVEARVQFAPQQLQRSHVEVAVQAASIDAGSAQTNALLQGVDWLDAKAFAQARFVSSGFTAAGPGRYWVSGDFSVRGHTHKLRVLVTTHAVGAALAMDAHFTLDRSSYGLGAGSWADTGVVAAAIPVHVHLLVAP